MPGQVTRGTPILDQRFSPTQEAETFAESGVTLTHTNTEVSGESVQLGVTAGTTASPGDDTETFSEAGEYGVEINPNKDLGGVRVTVSSNIANADTLYLKDGGGTTLDSVTGGIAADSTHDLTASLSSGVVYYVVLGDDLTHVENDTPSFPYSSTDIDVTGGAIGASNYGTKYWNITDVQALTDATSGSVSVEWDTPSDVHAHGYVNHQTTPDGETVTVDVEEYDGSSWNTVATGVSRGEDISAADASNPVRVVANFSRGSTANNPTLDYAAKSYIQ